VTFHHDQDGALVLEARLPPEMGAIVLEGLAAAAEAMYRRRRDDSAESSVNADLYMPPGPAEDIAEDPDVPWWARDLNETQSFSARRADALTLMAESLLENGAGSRPGGERNHIVVHVDADVLADPTSPGRSELENGPALAGESTRRLACDASVVRLLEARFRGIMPWHRHRDSQSRARTGYRRQDLRDPVGRHGHGPRPRRGECAGEGRRSAAGARRALSRALSAKAGVVHPTDFAISVTCRRSEPQQPPKTLSHGILALNSLY